MADPMPKRFVAASASCLGRRLPLRRRRAPFPLARMLPLITCVVALVFATPGSAQDAPARVASDTTARVLEGAHRQIGVTVTYDGSYRLIGYPNGDVPVSTGVCTDVLVRAYRAAGIDLQQRVHEDMRVAFERYPRLWGLGGPDRNIDHRRVPNLATYFTRHGTSLPPSDRAQDYRPGDIVTWRLPGGYPHIGLVADRSEAGTPLVIHNIGAGTRLEDVLFRYPITGHYRYEPEPGPAPGTP